MIVLQTNIAAKHYYFKSASIALPAGFADAFEQMFQALTAGYHYRRL